MTPFDIDELMDLSLCDLHDDDSDNYLWTATDDVRERSSCRI